METPFGWCFIGCGKLARQVARQITRSGRHRLVSVYTRSYEKCAAFAARYSAAACATAEEAITAPGADGVYLVTPHNTHYVYARQALELGRPVLCEKPLTVTAAQAGELTALAQAKGVYLAEAMWTWFAPAANQVKRWLDAGEFGQLRKVLLTCRGNARFYAPRVTDPARAGGALLDIGVYPLTYLYRLFGRPAEIKCVGQVSKGIDWAEEVSLAFPSGLTATASISIRDLFGRERLVIAGDKAKVSLPSFHNAGRVTLVRRGGKNETVSGSGSYLNEFDLAAGEIREGRTESRFVPHGATVAVMELMDECRRQMGLVYPFERGAEE